MEDLTKKIETFKFPEIEYPKVIEFLEELNEQDREEYERWLQKKLLIDKILEKNPYGACAAYAA